MSDLLTVDYLRMSDVYLVLLIADTYLWDVSNKSPSMSVSGSQATRGLVKDSTDGVRGERGFDSGVHTFKITAESEGGWGSFAQVGVCTEEASMHLDCKLLQMR